MTYTRLFCTAFTRSNSSHAARRRFGNKCLVPVGGRPLIHSVLESLSTAGLREATLVLGHFGDQIESHIGDGSRFGIRVHYAWNANYDGGNATSLWSAPGISDRSRGIRCSFVAIS